MRWLKRSDIEGFEKLLTWLGPAPNSRIQHWTEFILIVAGITAFSVWLFGKSFGFDAASGQYWVARHQVGDFGLHLSLVRSFSWGKNFPVESPFYPGKPLAYHWAFDLAVGLLERLGLRLDIAINGLSIIAFVALCYFVYLIPQKIFTRDRLLGIVSVLLFLLPSSLSFVDFVKGTRMDDFISGMWYLPDYLHKGPFDGSQILMFFTLNVFLNQRHLIAALAISLTILIVLLTPLMKRKSLSFWLLVTLGLVLGLSSRVHTLVFGASALSMAMLFVLFGRWRWFVPFFGAAAVAFLPHYLTIRTAFNTETAFSVFHPGYLAPTPLTVDNWLQFWWLNLGVALFTIPAGVWLSGRKQRRIFFAFLPLFFLANLVQLSFRIDHNHSLLNLFFLISVFYSAYIVVRLWRGSFAGKAAAVALFVTLTASGVLNLMAIKNDFRYPVPALTGEFSRWIRDNTDQRSIFLSYPTLLDPVTLSGRRNYVGASYYLDVMGYEYRVRREIADTIYSASGSDDLAIAAREGISYLVLPATRPADFPYQLNENFLQRHLQVVYKDGYATVYKL